MATITGPAVPMRPPVARDDRSFPWYVGAALGIAVLGGFVLALLLPLAAVLQWDWGVRWRALAQAHGHLQIGGWLGLFIAGMALRLAPRFAGRPLALARLTPLALALLIAGLLGRAVAQPLLDVPGMRALLLAGAVAELAGCGIVTLALLRTLAPAVRTLTPAPLLMLGATGLVAQALLAALWLPAIHADYPALPSDRNGALLTVQFFGFVLPFVLGVSFRALPTFFKHTAPSPRRAALIAAALGLGAGLTAAGSLLTPGSGAARTGGAGMLLIAVAVVTAIAHTGVWKHAERLRPSARGAALLIRTGYVWLSVAALWLLWDGAGALVSGDPVPAAHADGIRHVLALGVFTMLVFGMGQLMLPWLAMRRQRPGGYRGETWTLWALLSSATVLRVTGSLLEARGAGTDRYWWVAAAGTLGLAAIAFFAFTLLHARRAPKPEIPVIVR